MSEGQNFQAKGKYMVIQCHQNREYRVYCLQNEILLNWGFAEHPRTFD